MRQVKFRGKRIDDGEWIYGYLADVQEQYGYATINSYFDDKDGRWESCDHVDVNTVGQYTGLKDKNDKMIFEGDLIDAVVFDCFDNDKRHKLEVKWLGTGFYAVNTDKEDDAFELDWLLYQDDEAEVIGNIHEK